MTAPEQPPCPKCQQPMEKLTPEVNHSRWWKCPCDRRTYLIHSDGWLIVRTGSAD